MEIFNRIEIIIALVIVVIASIKIRSFIQRKGKLRKLAERLNLDFLEQPLDAQAESELAEIKNRKWVPWFQKFISLFSPWEIKGTFRGMPVRMWTRYRAYMGRRSETTGSARKRKEPFMRIEVCFPENLQLGLQIYSENPFVKGGYDGYDERRKEIQSVNQELNSKVKIMGISEERITRLLSRPDLVESLLQLFKKYDHAVVDDESVRVEEPKIILDADDCRTRLDALVLVASSMDRAIRFA